VSLVAVRDERTTRRVGAIALAVLAGAIGFFVFVYDRIEWKSRVRAQIYFRDVGGLRPGAGFVVAGRSVGRVESIVPVTRGSEGPLGGERGVAVTVAIDADEAARIHVRPWPWAAIDPRHPPADIFVASRGIVSERYLELAAAPAESPVLRDGDKLLGASPATLDSVLQRWLESMTAMRAFREELRPELDALTAQLAELDGLVDRSELAPMFGSLVALRGEFVQLREVSLGGDAGLAHARSVVQTLRRLIDDLRQRAAMLEPQISELEARAGTARDVVDAKRHAIAEKLVTVGSELERALAKADQLLAQIETIEGRLGRGAGTLMKLVGDPEFPEDMKELGKVLKRQPWKLLDTASDNSR
jgi:ABC-type transporter Mla subunit MlaD